MIIEFKGSRGWGEGDFHYTSPSLFGAAKDPIAGEILHWCWDNAEEVTFYKYRVDKLPRKFRKIARNPTSNVRILG